MPIYDVPDAYQEYLETIYRLSRRSPRALVTNLAIAEDLAIKPPSVTEMIEKLEEAGLVRWERRKGVKLTPKGRDIAKDVIRNHVLLKILFNKLFGIKEDEVLERLACDIEHHLAPNVGQAMEAAMRTAEIDVNRADAYDLKFIESLDELRVVNVTKARQHIDTFMKELTPFVHDQEALVRSKARGLLNQILES
jgi:DtxR family Mn-dependent transcriptional regulator